MVFLICNFGVLRPGASFNCMLIDKIICFLSIHPTMGILEIIFGNANISLVLVPFYEMVRS